MCTKRCGTETMKYVNGGEYKGEWKDDIVHGKGTRMKYANGNVYKGEFVDGKRCGTGTMKYVNGGEYKGEWKDDIKHGKGTRMKYANGNVYKGEFVDGKRCGTGMMKYVNGHEYEGEFKDGHKNGKGTITMSTGDIYDGQWENNLRNGEFTLTLANGDLFKQVYFQGELISKKRCASDVTPIHDLLPSPRSCADVTSDIIVLDEDDKECRVCNNNFLTDINAENENVRLHLPVIGSCQHIFCYGCVLQMARSRANIRNPIFANRKH